MKLSAHFTLAEFTHSAIAVKYQIDNTLPAYLLPVAKYSASQMERVKTALDDLPIMIVSGFRCASLNYYIGGADNSGHAKAEAIDFKCPEFGLPKQICKRILAAGIEFDQLILKYPDDGWVHISFCQQNNRYQVLTALKQSGKTVYYPGIILSE